MARYLLSARNRVVWKRVMQMKMKKRIALLLAAAMLSLSLCGCADDTETVGAVRSDGSVSDALATGLGVTVPEDETGRFASADGHPRRRGLCRYDVVHLRCRGAARQGRAARRNGGRQRGGRPLRLADGGVCQGVHAWTISPTSISTPIPGDETLSDACRQLDSVLNEVNDALCTALSDAARGPRGLRAALVYRRGQGNRSGRL